MELSQTSLAMLLLGGVPAGVALNLAYALTDIGAIPDGFWKKLICNVKDFVFATVAGLAAVLMVYFVNDGEFRYMVLVGMIGGFAASHLTLGKLVIYLRNAVIRIMTVPLTWIWINTLGRLVEKARAKALVKQTQIRTEQLMQLASNGFEN